MERLVFNISVSKSRPLSVSLVVQVQIHSSFICRIALKSICGLVRCSYLICNFGESESQEKRAPTHIWSLPECPDSFLKLLTHNSSSKQLLRDLYLSTKVKSELFALTLPAMTTNENLPPNVIKQLAKELKNLDETPPEGIKVGVNDDNFSVIFADIEGPAGTPYENGVFRMKLILSHDFPQYPPKGYFLTNIFHPNIATNGEICVNALKKDWNPNLGLRHVLIVIRCLLIEPFPESALNDQAGKMLLENYDEYAKHARVYTEIHALKPKPKFKTGTISESTTINVDQTNPSVKSVDHKNATSFAAPPSPLAPKPGNGQDQQSVALTSSTETGVSGSASLTQKREYGLTKVPADKKKMDARKKSLKRL